MTFSGPGSTSRLRRGQRLARGLGWFSIGLGVAKLARPGRVASLVGVPEDSRSRVTLSALGVRELVTGVGILTRPRPAGWMWMRVAGDLIDLALLGVSVRRRRSEPRKLTAALGAVLGVTLLDAFVGRRLSRAGGGSARALAARVREQRETITINRPPEQVYRLWRALESWPRFLSHVESVQVLDERRARWVLRGALGRPIELNVDLVEDRPNERIAWRSLPDSPVRHSGVVRLVPAPGGRGTEVHLQLRYEAPRAAGATLAKLLGPAPHLHGDLHRLKQLIETGEVTRSDASIHRGLHPAQPPGEAPRTGNGRPEKNR